MKKVIAPLVALVVVVNCCVFFAPRAKATTLNVITCYSTFDDGTTNFTNCNGCSSSTGSNLKDKSTCK